MKTYTQLSPEEKKSLVDSYNSKCTIRELSEEYGLPIWTVRATLKSEGVELSYRRKPSTITPELERQVVYTYTEKIKTSVAKVAKKYHITRASAYAILKRNNVQLRPPGDNKRRQNLDGVLQLWNHGKATQTIGKQLNLSRYLVAVMVAQAYPESPRVVNMVRTVVRAAIRNKVQYEEVKSIKRWMQLPGECDICKTPSKLVLDHCHRTGVVRGLLCHHCNTGLGHFRDSKSSLARAITYLSTY